MSEKVLEIGRRVTSSKNLRKVLRQGQNIPTDFINLPKCLTAHRIKTEARFSVFDSNGRRQAEHHTD